MSAAVTSKGQITLPKDLRDCLGLKKGDRVAFDVEDGVITVKPERGKDNPFAVYWGALKAFDSVEEINAWVAELRDDEC